ncbi:MAG: lamin tail domain-containing protein [Bacteroidia bacterium]
MKKGFAFIGLVLMISACTTDKNTPVPIAANGPGGKDNIIAGTLVINEFEARGSRFFNELILPGNPEGGSDWIEIYNTTNDTITLEKGKWFLTDSLPDADLFQLPECKINPKDYLVVWCDSKDTTITQIHSNFSLNKNGEDIGLFYKDAKGVLKQIDGFTFHFQQVDGSKGRFPDGSANLKSFDNPTPGTSNYE